MQMMGFSFNFLSTLGLTLTIGILVDDSIVVLENILRRLGRGEPPREAAVNGRAEIGLAAVAITLVDVVVFAPVGLVSGQIGGFFREFGFTIAAATLISLVVSFTLTPMLAARFLKHRPVSFGRNPAARFGRAWDRGFANLEHRSAIFRHAVTDTDVLDPAGYARVLRALVNVLYGLERFLQAYARFKLLASAEYVAYIQRVQVTHLPAVYSNLLGENIDHRVHRKSRLICAEPAHRSARRTEVLRFASSGKIV